MQAPTKEESTSARRILMGTDPDSHAVLTHDAAITQLLPRLRLPTASNPDGTTSSALDTFESAWRVIDGLASQEGFIKKAQVAQLVRLMGYAQIGEVIAGADLGGISNMLRKPGPSCRIYGWTVQEGASFDKPPSPEEAMLADAILIEGGKHQYGVLDGEASRDVFRRSGLDNQTLAIIWELVDAEARGFLDEKGVLRMLRLISCAQRRLRLHARMYEDPCPLPDLDDSFISLEDSAPQQAAATTNPEPPIPTPSFSQPQSLAFSGGFHGLRNPSILTPAPSVPQQATLLTRPTNDPLPPLTDREKNAFMAIFDRHDPHEGAISGAQGIQILSRSQLPTNVLAQIWDLADADRSGSLSRGEFVIAMYLVKLLMDRRRANPGREDEQMPSEVPPWLRAEAARMDGGGNRMTPMSTDVVGGPIGPGGFRIPGSTPMSTPYRPPDRPPSPSLLDLDNEALPSQPPSLGINNSSTRHSPNPSLQDYLNRPVPPTPQQRTSEDAPPPYVELDNTFPLHSRVRSVS